MKKLIALVLALVLCLSLCSCGTKTLSGTYTNENGKQSLTFSKDGTFKYSAEVLGIGVNVNGTYTYDEAEDDFNAKMDTAVLGSLEHSIKVVDKANLTFDGVTFTKK